MKIVVEVAYALPDAQEVIQIELNEDARVEDAIVASGVLPRHPEIDLGAQRVGIWGRPVTLMAGLRNGDRVEIYRPLAADPKLSRRKRAAAVRSRLR